MRQINVGVVGTGWCGALRAQTAANSALVNEVHVAETNVERLQQVAREIGAKTATADYRELVANDDIDALMISATPESLHYPMAKATLEGGKHLLLEKPISITLNEADELVELAEARGVKFTIGYSQRFNDKQALVKRSIDDGTLGEPISALISRHITRKLGAKIGGRIVLSPAAMEATHDIDFLLWCLQPAKPVRVYAQSVERVMKPKYGTSDVVWMIITMDNGVVITIGAGWILPPGYPNFSSTWIEVVGTEGALMLDDTHRDVLLTTTSDGTVFPLSTMPGEPVGHVYSGPMEPETISFLEAVAYDREVVVKPHEARQAMEVYLAADLSAERDEPVSLPLTREEAEIAVKVGVSN